MSSISQITLILDDQVGHKRHSFHSGFSLNILPVLFYPPFSVLLMLQYKYLLQKGEVPVACLMLLDWPVSETAPTAN